MVTTAALLDELARRLEHDGADGALEMLAPLANLLRDARTLERLDEIGSTDLESEAIHAWFGLTYANYLVLPRTLLQSMPATWQRPFVDLLRELDLAFAHIDTATSYRVHVIDDAGRYATDPVPHYNRGRTKVTRADELALDGGRE